MGAVVVVNLDGELAQVRCGLPLLFLEGVDRARDDAAPRGVEQGGFLIDQAAVVRVNAALVKRAPAEGRAGLDDFVKAPALAFPDRDGLVYAQIGTHDLQQRPPSAAHLGRQALTDDPT